MPLVYTFGNHQHWVDLQWLWGYHVLPGAVRDMYKFCRGTGAKGCVNFDGIGYEKMASECPEELADLKQAVQEGWMEPVGCSYGQPYGLFHGGESNVRQRVYGVRTAMRVLGYRPKTFWEEEFDFFPQLPQMLRGVGLDGAALYFQWTWHTPEVPFEAAPVVWWEGHDGSRILTATRNRLNLHQWPEDFQILLDELAEYGPEEVLRRGATPGNADGGDDKALSASKMSRDVPPLILQWLELMPSQDWMCRSELMIPKMKQLLDDERFEVQFATLGQYLERQRESGTGDVPVRKYSLDQVWHGMTLGKNGDFMRKESERTERTLLEAEALHAILGVFGRPYANWDVYPVWEFEEAWRELLSAQHHDNDECEGLCGHVGKASYRRAYSLARHQWFAAKQMLCARIQSAPCHEIHLNCLCWPSDRSRVKPSQAGILSSPVPPFGFRVESRDENRPAPQTETTAFVWDSSDSSLKSTQGHLVVRPLAAKATDELPVWVEAAAGRDGHNQDADPETGLIVKHLSSDGQSAEMTWRAEPSHRGNIGWTTHMDRPKGGLNAAQKMRFEFGADIRVWADHPYGVSEVVTGQCGRKKYPTGDWMTSPQWFESVESAFTSTSFVKVRAGSEQWLITHAGCRQWFLSERAIECVINAYDPWDEDYFADEVATGWHVRRCEGHTFSDCYRESRGWHGTFTAASYPDKRAKVGDIALSDFSFLRVQPTNVLVTALFRETEDYSGRDLESYAGRGMGYPYVLRLVEYDGLDTDVDLNIVGPIAKAFKTNLLGEIEEELSPGRGDDRLLTTEPENLKPFGIEAARLRFKMRPHEIATLYLDIVPGRKRFRDLDAKREVWATVHRTEAPSSQSS